MSEEKGTKKAASTTMFNFTEEVVERRLPFKPVAALNNLCLGYLTDVRIEMATSEKLQEDGTENPWEYAGIEVPSLVLTFKQARGEGDSKDRFYEHRFKVVTSVANDGGEVAMKDLASIYGNMYNQLRHIGNAFKGLKNYNLEIGQAPGIDPKATAKIRAEQFNKFFEYWVELFKGTGEAPMYTGIKLWIKLVADYRTRKFLGFPTFVGRGFIERVVEKMQPTIEIDIAAGESIELSAGKTGSKTAKAMGGETTSGTETPVVDDETAKILAQYQ